MKSDFATDRQTSPNDNAAAAISGQPASRDTRQPLQVPVLEAAFLLSISRMTLYRMRERGEISFGCYRGKAMVSTAELMRVHKLMSGVPLNMSAWVPACVLKKARPKKVKLKQ